MAGDAYHIKYKSILLYRRFVVFALYWFRIIISRFHFPEAHLPDHLYILSTPRVSCDAGVSYILPSKQYSPSLRAKELQFRSFEI